MSDYTEIIITIRRCVIKKPEGQGGASQYVYVALIEYPGGRVGVHVHEDDQSLARLVHNRIIDEAGDIRLS